MSKLSTDRSPSFPNLSQIRRPLLALSRPCLGMLLVSYWYRLTEWRRHRTEPLCRAAQILPHHYHFHCLQMMMSSITKMMKEPYKTRNVNIKSMSSTKWLATLSIEKNTCIPNLNDGASIQILLEFGVYWLN